MVAYGVVLLAQATVDSSHGVGWVVRASVRGQLFLMEISSRKIWVWRAGVWLGLEGF